MTTPKPVRVIALQEWNQIHGVSQSTANKWAHDERLPVYRSGKNWLILASTPRPANRGPRVARLARPQYVTIDDWSSKAGVPHNTTLGWISKKVITDAYLSCGLWLIRADLPTPGPQPQGAAAYRARAQAADRHSVPALNRSVTEPAAPAQGKVRRRRPAGPVADVQGCLPTP